MTERGTSLICVAAEDGTFLAADDLVYTEADGQVMPLRRDFRKVGATERVLIGTAGLMIYSDVAYDVNSWFTELIEELGPRGDELPSTVAEGIYKKLHRTFSPGEPLVARGHWKTYASGDRLVNYIVAGYTKNFKRPYIFEIGVEMNGSRDGLAFVGPIHHRKSPPHTVRFGEDRHYERADAGIEPEHSVWEKYVDALLPAVTEAFPRVSATLQESIACTVACIKVEGHFNPQRVGSKVYVVLTSRTCREIFTAAF
jgi:hypothetical protein